MLSLSYIKAALRSGKYTELGGYPLYFIASDGEALSYEAVRECFKDVVRAHLRGDRRDQWLLCGHEVNWEYPEMFCAHTGKRIEPAYPEH